MAVNPVQTAVATSGASAVGSLAKAFASNNTAGNLLIAVADIEWGGSTPAMTIADTQGNTWHQPTGFETDPDVSDTGIWYCWNCKGGANTVTVTSTVGNVNMALIIREYPGGAGNVQNSSDPLDKSVIANGNSTALSSGATATLSQANELVVGIGTSEHPNETFTLGTGYGNQSTENDVNLPHEAISIEDKTVSATTAVTAAMTGSTSSFWVMAVMTFKLAPASAANGNMLEVF